MEDMFEIFGVSIPLRSIRDYRLGLSEYIYRPCYRKVSSGFWGTRYEFCRMFPYAAVLAESGHAATGAARLAADLLGIRALKSKKYRCRKVTGMEVTLFLDDIPAILLDDNGKQSDVYKDDDLYRRLGEPIAPIIQTVQTLTIRTARDEYVFYGNEIQLSDAEADAERLREALITFKEAGNERRRAVGGARNEAGRGIEEIPSEYTDRVKDLAGLLLDTALLPVDIINAIGTGKKRGLVARLNGLKRNLDAGVISREEYNKQVYDIVAVETIPEGGDRTSK